MAVPTQTLPTIGEVNSSADPKTYNCLQELQSVLAGGVDSSNITDGSIATADLAAQSVTNAKLDQTTVTPYLGLSDGTAVRRGKSIIATTESRTNAAYGLLTTPDRVQNVVLPTDGLICVGYEATWQESVAGAARAAIFIGANQLKLTGAGGAPGVQETQTSAGAANVDEALFSATSGLAAQASRFSGAYTGDVTTGQLLGGSVGGHAEIFAAAGTYDISIQFKASSGSVTAKNRKLWVWTIGF